MARVLVLLVILTSLHPSSHGILPTCRQVTQMVTPCLFYLADRTWAPYGPCCNGLAALNRTASSPADRVGVCNCLKAIAPHMPVIDVSRASTLPRTCGINFNVTISPYADCDR